ncbi:hypothetical protein SSAG_04520 [Streptomyces sp. Mg1]|nr:hypothetical protein SSAG_04520 [Streptomyces sp. Mg1]
MLLSTDGPQGQAHAGRLLRRLRWLWREAYCDKGATHLGDGPCPSPWRPAPLSRRCPGQPLSRRRDRRVPCRGRSRWPRRQGR